MRGQAAFEFIMMIGFAMFLLALLLVVAVTLGADKLNEQRDKVMYDYGNMLKEELILATTVHEGYARDIILPQSIGRFNYEITTNTQSFTLTSAQRSYTFTTPEVTGSFSKGLNTIRYDGSLSIQ